MGAGGAWMMTGGGGAWWGCGMWCICGGGCG